MSNGVRLMHRCSGQFSSVIRAFLVHRARFLFAVLVLSLLGAAPLARAVVSPTFTFESAIGGGSAEVNDTAFGVTLGATLDTGANLLVSDWGMNGTNNLANDLTDFINPSPQRLPSRSIPRSICNRWYWGAGPRAIRSRSPRSAEAVAPSMPPRQLAARASASPAEPLGPGSRDLR